MIEQVSVHVEAAIYLYLVFVAAIGCYLWARLWIASRRRGEYADGANPN